MTQEIRPGVIRLTNTLGAPWTELHIVDGQMHRLTQGATRMERVEDHHVQALCDRNNKLASWLRANGIRPKHNAAQQEGLF